MLTPTRPGGDAPPPGEGEVALAALLADRPAWRMRPGLERVRAMLEELGGPERAFRSLHVGGTNGKGSVAATAATLLRSAGRRVGLYTSPHLLDVRERFRVDGAPVPEELLRRVARRLRPVAEDHDATYFEALTCVAFVAFAEMEVEWAVIETGLGGRLDATNVVRPAACAVTGVAVDHTETLGGSLRRIATEKAGILKPGVPAVVGPVRRTPALVLRSRAVDVGAPLRWLAAPIGPGGAPVHLPAAAAAGVGDVAVGRDGTDFTYDAAARPAPLRLRTPLVGYHQALNAAVALLLLEELPEPLPDDVLRAGLARVRWPGRLQTARDGRGEWILDAAHNPDALVALEGTLRALPGPPPAAIVLAVLRDKPWARMVALVAGRLARDARVVVLTVPPSAPPGRAWDPERAARLLEALGAGRPDAPRVLAVPSREGAYGFGRALETARELAGGGAVLVTGSSYLVGDALRVLRGAEPEPGGRDD